MISHRYLLIFLTCLLTLKIQAQGYLVTTNRDTVWLNKPIEVDASKSYQWKHITYDSTTYAVAELNSLYLDGNTYRVIDHQLWQQIISGKVNVFVRALRDTLGYRRGSFPHKVYMQQSDTGSFQTLNYRNLSLIYPGMQINMERSNIGRKAGKASLVIGGIVTCAASVIVTLVGTLEEVLVSHSEGKTLILGGVSGIGLGAGVLVTGASIKTPPPKSAPSILNEIRRINKEY